MTHSRAAGRAIDALSEGALIPARGLGWPLRISIGLALGVGFLAAYYGTMRKLLEHWSSNDMYSYGFLVPVIAAYLVWLRRDRLAAVPIVPNFAAGVPVLAAGLALLVLGRVSATNLVEELSLPITVWGMVLLVFGGGIARRLTFPLAYLFTMIPFWDIFTGRLHLPFQLYSASMGVGALRLFDIPVFHRGVLIELPNVTLEVAELCSGVNNLVAILCIGVPLTQFYVKGWPKRLVIIVVAAWIALISNGLRVATVCLFAYYGIRGANGDIHGPFALMRSLVISGVGFATLFWLISRFADRTDADMIDEVDSPTATSIRRRVVAPALAAALTIAAATFDGWHSVRSVPVRPGMVAFPTRIGTWESNNRPMLTAALATLDFDAKLHRGYVAPDGREVDLFLGYLATQTQGRELGGEELFWGLDLSGRWYPSRSVGDGRMRDAVLSGPGGKVYATYAYVMDGDLIADELQVKLRTTWGVLSEGRSNGAIMVIAGRLDEGDSVESARERYRDFVESALPPSAQFLAGSNEVTP